MKCKKLKLTFGINFFEADKHLLALLEAPSELRTRFHAVRDQREGWWRVDINVSCWRIGVDRTDTDKWFCPKCPGSQSHQQNDTEEKSTQH